MGPSNPAITSVPDPSASFSVFTPEPSTMVSTSSKISVEVPSVTVPTSGLRFDRSMVKSSVTAERSSTSPVVSATPSASTVSLPKPFSMMKVSSPQPPHR